MIALCACARPVGDFGRAEPSLVHDIAMPVAGAWRARAAKEAVSDFQLTDEEQEMRDRVWRFLVAPHSYDWFGDIATELYRTRLSPSGRAGRTDAYYQWLHREAFASSHTRYGRLADDVQTDAGTALTTFASICAVRRIDDQRLVAAREITSLEQPLRDSASARRAENAAVIDSFVAGLTFRYGSYSYALDHLLAETPHKEAIDVDADLSELASYVDQARQGDFCSPARFDAHDGAVRTLRPRVLTSSGPILGS